MQAICIFFLAVNRFARFVIFVYFAVKEFRIPSNHGNANAIFFQKMVLIKVLKMNEYYFFPKNQWVARHLAISEPFPNHNEKSIIV